MFGKLLGAVAGAMDRYTDKETAEGTVAIMLGAANADGEYGVAEARKFSAACDTDQVLRKFSREVLLAKHDALLAEYRLDAEVGEAAVLRELREVDPGNRDAHKREAVFRMGRVAARAEGGIGDAERAFLRRAASALRVDPALADA